MNKQNLMIFVACVLMLNFNSFSMFIVANPKIMDAIQDSHHEESLSENILAQFFCSVKQHNSDKKNYAIDLNILNGAREAWINFLKKDKNTSQLYQQFNELGQLHPVPIDSIEKHILPIEKQDGNRPAVAHKEDMLDLVHGQRSLTEFFNTFASPNYNGSNRASVIKYVQQEQFESAAQAWQNCYSLYCYRTKELAQALDDCLAHNEALETIIEHAEALKYASQQFYEK